MKATVTMESGNIYINSLSLEEILLKVYQKGLADASGQAKDEKVSFIQLSKELAEKGRNLSVRTLQAKAREANVKLFRDGKRLSLFRKDVKTFVTI